MSGRYSVEMNRSASATLAVGALNQDATTPRQGSVYDLAFGSEASPADNPFLWTVERGNTSLGTSTGVTPAPLDSADAASIIDAGENHTVNPTLGDVLLSVPLNQRATFRWVAAPGSELVLPATANNSILVRTPTSTAVAVTATMLFIHH